MNIFKITILSVFLLTLSTSSVLASGFSLSPINSQVEEGDSFSMTVYLTTEGEVVNTIEGDLNYNDEILELEQVRTGGSFISFWIEKPDGKNGSGAHFSGVVPGGINTTKGEVFSLVFKAKTKGQANVLLDNLNLYLNDGEGTKTTARSAGTNIYIVNSNPDTPEFTTEDNIIPEEFDVERAKEVSVYENKWFVAFNAQDKGTGVDYYKVCEFWSCSITASPYVLRNQSPFYYISIKAYDLNGNSRSSSLISPYLVLVVLVPLALYGFYRRFYLKKI